MTERVSQAGQTSNAFRHIEMLFPATGTASSQFGQMALGHSSSQGRSLMNMLFWPLAQSP